MAVWGSPRVWGDWLIGLSALNAGNQVVDCFLDHPSHRGYWIDRQKPKTSALRE